MTPYYDDGVVTIYHGDSRELVAEVGAFDLILTDPPYGTQALGDGYGRRQNHDPAGRQGKTIQGDHSLEVATQALAAARGVLALTPGLACCCHLVAFCHPSKLLEFGLALDLNGWDFRGELMWDKSAPGLGRGLRYMHEPALWFSAGAPAPAEPPMLSVIRERSNRDTQDARRHPHEKPLRFWGNALRLPGRVVLDPFAGSGSVGRACKNAGRRCILIEAEERWCEVAADRCRQEVCL